MITGFAVAFVVASFVVARFVVANFVVAKVEVNSESLSVNEISPGDKIESSSLKKGTPSQKFHHIEGSHLVPTLHTLE